MNDCPVCGREIVVDEDWEFGRITRCGIHYRKVERFDKLQSPDLLDESEIQEERDKHAA